jgi:hypothetical protein
MAIPTADQIVGWFSAGNESMRAALARVIEHIQAVLSRRGSSDGPGRLLLAEQDRLQKLIQRLASLQSEL